MGGMYDEQEDKAFDEMIRHQSRNKKPQDPTQQDSTKNSPIKGPQQLSKGEKECPNCKEKGYILRQECGVFSGSYYECSNCGWKDEYPPEEKDTEKRVDEVIRYCKGVIDNNANDENVKMLAGIIVEVFDKAPPPVNEGEDASFIGTLKGAVPVGEGEYVACIAGACPARMSFRGRLDVCCAQSCHSRILRLPREMTEGEDNEKVECHTNIIYCTTCGVFLRREKSIYSCRECAEKERGKKDELL